MQRITNESARALSPKMKHCLMCDEEILITAQKCKHCGEYLNPAVMNATPHKRGHSKTIGIWLCIVVLIVIAGLLAFPYIRQARIKANEDAVVAKLFQINKAQVHFFESEKRSGTLTELFSRGLIESSKEEQAGYRFYIGLDRYSIMFTVTANPIDYGSTGIRSFYTSGVFIHAADKHGSVAGENDPRLLF